MKPPLTGSLRKRQAINFLVAPMHEIGTTELMHQLFDTFIGQPQPALLPRDKESPTVMQADDQSQSV
jgi:hypothetical protein